MADTGNLSVADIAKLQQQSNIEVQIVSTKFTARCLFNLLNNLTWDDYSRRVATKRPTILT